MVFGSFARKESYSDIDVCLILDKKTEKMEMSRLRLSYLKDFPSFDIHVFQQLPLYIRVRVLKEGKILFCRDMGLLYDAAFAAIKEFEDFRPVYESYLEGVMNA